MKKFIAWSLLCMLGGVPVLAQKTDAKAPAAKETKVRREGSQYCIRQDNSGFGNLFGRDPIVKCTFTFTNEGNAPLVIHQAIASCGCTVPTYTRMPVKPGEKGKMEVTYNGSGKYPGRFKKSITVRTNAKEPMVKLYITGVMTASEKDKK